MKPTKPRNIFNKPLRPDFKALFRALSKGIAHVAIGKWDDVAADSVEALSGLGLATDPEELAYSLIRRSLARALFDLVGEGVSERLPPKAAGLETLLETLDSSLAKKEFPIDRRFLDRPTALPLLDDVQTLLEKWLEGLGMSAPSARATAQRVPGYFASALHQEWTRNSRTYTPLLQALDSPFVKAGEREWAWSAYSAILNRRVQEGVFREPFSLEQIYIPLNAFYYDRPASKDVMAQASKGKARRRKVIVSLTKEIDNWLQTPSVDDAIRVISGGPGSGKSSFVRMLAARVSRGSRLKVLYVPLHLIDPSKNLVEEIGRFVKDEGVLPHNPLAPEGAERNLLVIFDGLDELAVQGRVAADLARAFLREVERTVETRNSGRVRLRVLISGREVVIQENELELRRARQVLTLLPYYTPESSLGAAAPLDEGEEYQDPEHLLENDLRQDWWRKFGALTSGTFTGLPEALRRDDLDEVTAQPLLNCLLALSYTRKKIDFTSDINLNAIYADLVGAVYERAYERRGAFGPIQHIDPGDFFRILEEIGLVAWHGDGRTATVQEIEEHFRASVLGKTLDAFREGAKAGVTRLLAAFFFRQFGHRPGGEATFVFTHKSLGEYLTARRIARAAERVVRGMEEAKGKDPEEVWDERRSLGHWVQVCGRAALSPEIYSFVRGEAQLRDRERIEWLQQGLARLFSYVLQHATPMELAQPPAPFRDALIQSRNAEEALVAVLNACARITEILSPITYSTPFAFGAWLRRVQGQHSGSTSCLAARCLSYLDLHGVELAAADFYRAVLAGANLEGCAADLACFSGADLRKARLKKARMMAASLHGVHLEDADLEKADLRGAIIVNGRLSRSNLRKAKLGRAVLESAQLVGANLEDANLEGANLTRANLDSANLSGANLSGANLFGASLIGAITTGANFGGADTRETCLQHHDLPGASA